MRLLLLLLQMPSQKECILCKQKIGVASKTCTHCGAKQPYKQKLENIKRKLSLGWKERQKKNSSVNKVYDATDLLVLFLFHGESVGDDDLIKVQFISLWSVVFIIYISK